MSSERIGLLLKFMLCLVAAAPLAWGVDGVQGRNPGASAVATGSVDSTKSSTPKVSVCHVPNGNPEKAVTLLLSQSAVQKHLDHGGILRVRVGRRWQRQDRRVAMTSME